MLGKQRKDPFLTAVGWRAAFSGAQYNEDMLRLRRWVQDAPPSSAPGGYKTFSNLFNNLTSILTKLKNGFPRENSGFP